MATRPLTEQERGVLLHVLSAPVVGADALRAQVGDAEVVDDDQSPGVSLSVPASVPRAPVGDGPWPALAYVYDGSSYRGELLVWVKNGYLDALEYAWVTDERPRSLPETSSISVSPQV